MLITPNVELPEELLAGRAEGQLVIFAGAGVSQGPPSNLPSFRRLAHEIAPPGREQTGDETVDQFLGRLASDRVKVHRLVSDYISSADSRPTELHENLLRLFEKSEEVRLVTTNFDRHFVSVAEEMFENEIPVYAGPAVPLGGEFRGIVHLHGLVGKGRPRDLVITDQDFGRAYVTDGWAARFLAEVFQNYRVLFVGYSHRDQVVRYLARGIVPRDSRFAFQSEDEDPDFWKRHGVELVSYPREDDDDEHKELRQAVRAWVQRTQLGATDQEQKIQRILSSGLPLDPVDEDYLRGALGETSTTRFFIRHASAPDWLEWIEDRDPFTQLFDPRQDVDEVGQHLSYWFARQIVCRDPDRGIETIVDKGPVMNRVLWNSVARAVSQEDQRPSGDQLARLVGLLLTYPPQVVPSHALEMILGECDPREDTEAALLLSEFLLEPVVEIRRRPALSRLANGDEAEMRLYPRLHLRGAEHYLRENVEELLERVPDLVTDRLLSVAGTHLRKAHSLLESYDRASGLTGRRSAIEPHSQDQYKRDVDILIETARDAAELAADQGREYVDGLFNQWEASVPILERMAVHILRGSSYHAADEKIDWTIKNDLVFNVDCRHEVYMLLQDAYPDASNGSREELLEVIEAGPDIPDDGGDIDAEHLRDSARFRLLNWLSEEAPEEDRIHEMLARIQDRRGFSEPEHPEFGMWSTGVRTVTAVSPRSVDELVEMDPSDANDLEWLLSYEGEAGFEGPSREGLVEEITTTVEESFEWGKQLAKSLAQQGEWQTDLWRGFLSGLENLSLSSQQWRTILTLLAEAPELPDRNAWALLRTLEAGVKEEGIPSELLGRVEGICETYYRGMERYFDLDPDTRNLLTSSLNNIAGRAIHLLLHVLIRRWREEDTWEQLPVAHRELYEDVTASETTNAQAALPMLASRLHFLYDLDQEWTSNYLIPLFGWEEHDEEAQLVWHGYLTWGRWNDEMLEHLLPMYRQTVEHVNLLGELDRQLWGHIAHIAVFSSRDSVRDGWLYQILEATDLEGRAGWANAMSTALGQLDAEGQQEAWEEWLSDYWQDRINGIPVRLAPDEVGAMMTRWLLSLQSVFPELVERLIESPRPTVDGYGVMWNRVEDSDLAEEYPAELARLIEYLLAGFEGQYLGSRFVASIVEQLIDAEVEADRLRRICDDLSRLGYADAQELQDSIESDDSGE